MYDVTYPAYPHAQLHEGVDCILLRHREAGMLIQSPPIFVWHAVAMLDVECDDPDFIHVAVEARAGRITGRGMPKRRRILETSVESPKYP